MRAYTGRERELFRESLANYPVRHLFRNSHIGNRHFVERGHLSNEHLEKIRKFLLLSNVESESSAARYIIFRG